MQVTQQRPLFIQTNQINQGHVTQGAELSIRYALCPMRLALQ